MKFLSFAGYFTLNLFLALVLSVILSILMIPPYSPSIEDIVAITSESGRIHGNNSASVIWEEYLSEKHALSHRLAEKRLVVFQIVFLVLIPVCWLVVTRRLLRRRFG